MIINRTEEKEDHRVPTSQKVSQNEVDVGRDLELQRKLDLEPQNDPDPELRSDPPEDPAHRKSPAHQRDPALLLNVTNLQKSSGLLYPIRLK